MAKITFKNITDTAVLTPDKAAANVSPVMIATDAGVPDQALTAEGRKILASNTAPTYFDPEAAFAADFGIPAGGFDVKVPVNKEGNLEYVTVKAGKSFELTTESETDIAMYTALKDADIKKFLEITIA